jgi:hypothetical protein
MGPPASPPEAGDWRSGHGAPVRPPFRSALGVRLSRCRIDATVSHRIGGHPDRDPGHAPGGQALSGHRTENGSAPVMIGHSFVIESCCADADPMQEPENKQHIILLMMSDAVRTCENGSNEAMNHFQEVE